MTGLSLRPAGLLIVCAALASLAVLPMPTRPASANDAPMWESPTGLVPGHPGHRVRMVSERVDIEVFERDDEIRASVQASYDLLNEGEDIEMPVGFPEGTFPWDYATLSLDRVDAFQVWTDERAYEAVLRHDVKPVEQEIVFEGQPRTWGDWYVWQMHFRPGESIRVHVRYVQSLTRRWSPDSPPAAWAQPTYILRTGRYWHGVIGEATIVMTATGGGAFLGGPEVKWGLDGQYPARGQIRGPVDAATSTSDRIVWHFREFEPTWDVGTTYIRSDLWQRLHNAEAAIARGSATPEQYLDGVAAAQPLLGSTASRQPLAIVEGYAARALDWARTAAELAPERADAWEAVGDREFWSVHTWEEGELECWPTPGSAAYRRAAELGSLTAAEKLDHEAGLTSNTAYPPGPPVRPCSGPPDEVLIEARYAPRALEGAAWVADTAREYAFGKGQAVDVLPAVFAGRALDEVTGEAERLRQRGQYRDVRSADPGRYYAAERYEIVSISRPDMAVVLVHYGARRERLYDQNDTLLRSDFRGPGAERMTLRLFDDTWKVVEIEPDRPANPAPSARSAVPCCCSWSGGGTASGLS